MRSQSHGPPLAGGSGGGKGNASRRDASRNALRDHSNRPLQQQPAPPLPPTQAAPGLQVQPPPAPAASTAPRSSRQVCLKTEWRDDLLFRPRRARASSECKTTASYDVLCSPVLVLLLRAFRSASCATSLACPTGPWGARKRAFGEDRAFASAIKATTLGFRLEVGPC